MMGSSRWSRTGLAVGAAAVLVLVAGAGAGSAAAQPAPRRGGDLKVAAYEDPGTLDPHITTSIAGARLRNNFCEGLVAWDSRTAEKPMLADSWTVSGDGIVYTFKLRRGVVFHGGQELRAEDVKYTFERILKVSPRRTDYDAIAKVEALDPLTVRFTLKAPSNAFLPNLAMYWAKVVQKDSTEQQIKDRGEVQVPNCTGPFRVGEYKRGQHLRLVRHDQYRPRPEKTDATSGAKTAWLDTVTFLFVETVNVRALMLQNGEVHYAQRLAPEQVADLRKHRQVEVVAIPSTMWGGIFFNFTRAPFSELPFRQAVATALDYKEINEAVFYGTGKPNNSMIPEAQAVWRTPEHARMHETNLDKARELLKRSSYRGEEIPFETRKDSVFDLTTQSIQAQLAKAGIKVKLVYLETAAQLDSFYARRRNTTPGWGIGIQANNAYRPDPDGHYYTRAHSSAHAGLWKHAEYDELVQKARAERSFEQRRKMYAQAQAMIMREIPMIALYSQPYIEAYAKKLRGVEAREPHFDWFFNAWLEP